MEEIQLSPGEWVMMQLLWREAPKTITQITSELKEKTGWSKHTVITMLRRLTAKGAVRFEEGERAKHYYPRVKREKAIAVETESFLDKVYAGSLNLMLTAMVEQKRLSKKEIEALYDILEKSELEESDSVKQDPARSKSKNPKLEIPG